MTENSDPDGDSLGHESDGGALVRAEAYASRRAGPPRTAANLPRHASFLERSFAMSIDLLLLTVLIFGVAELLLRMLGILQAMHLIVPVRLASAVFVCVIYFFCFDASAWKGSPGKRLLGLRVTTPRGRRISHWQAALRTLITLLLAPLPVFFLSMLLSKKRQAVQDHVADTLVLRKAGESLLPDTVAGWEPILLAVATLVLFSPYVWAFGATAKTVAGPLYLEHQRKERVARALEAVRPVQAFVEVAMQKDRRYPRLSDEMLATTAHAAKAIVNYNPGNGVLTIQFSAPQVAPFAGISLHPRPAGSAAFNWSCTGFGISVRALPAGCTAVGT